jgi:hypothetical protein
MALVDGQLAPAEVPDLVRELARDPALVAELQAYLATAERRLAEPFEARRGEPLPARLVEAVMQAPVAGDSRRERPMADRPRGLLDRLKQRYRVPGWSLAAGPALAAAALALGVWLAAPPHGRVGPVEANLSRALERTESGREAALVALRPVLSFKSKTAQWCRQYELRHATKQVSYGLACRNDGGRWDVLAATPPSSIATRPAAPGPRKAIDELVTAMMGSQPLSSSDEAARIGEGWSRL